MVETSRRPVIRPVSALVESRFICEDHNCPRVCFARHMPEPELRYTACRQCSIAQALSMDEVMRRHYAALLKRALGPAIMADLLEVADEGLAEDERILAGVLFTAGLNGSDLAHTLDALVTHQTKERGIETLNPHRPN